MTQVTSAILGATLRKRYRLDAEIGAGGMGVVDRAHDLELGRDVAIKVVTGARDDAEGRRVSPGPLHAEWVSCRIARSMASHTTSGHPR